MDENNQNYYEDQQPAPQTEVNSQNEAAYSERGGCYSAPQENRPFVNYDSPKAVKKPVRRIGTVTLGLTLIAVGALLLGALLLDDFSILWAAKFAPAVLILIGIEIVIGYFVNRGERVKYDFLSMFVCLLLIGGSIGCSVILPIARYAEASHKASYEVEQILEEQLYQSVRQFSFVKNASVSVYSRSESFSLDWGRLPDASEIVKNGDYDGCLYMDLKGNYGDEKAFAADVKKILDALPESCSRYEDMIFRWRRQNEDRTEAYYELSVDGRYGTNWTAEELAEEVEAWREPTTEEQLSDEITDEIG